MNNKTVFIIGAGASNEAGLPTGNGLKKEIVSLVDLRFDVRGNLVQGDTTFYEALRKYAQGDYSITKYTTAASQIRVALPQAISIDHLIDAHRDDSKIAFCGKLAIVLSILNAEKDSLLYINRSSNRKNINYNSLNSTWYNSYFKLITENCTKDNLPDRFKAITMIIFNYDRCVEHFIYYALQNYYRIPSSHAAKLVQNINFYYPYGQVGILPWVDRNGSIEFGEIPDSNKLLELSKKIKTFTESIDPKFSDIIKMHNHIRVAERVVFLGFHFHKLNMKLITPDQSYDSNNSNIKCFATTYNMSDNDKEIIQAQIRELYSGESTVSMTNKKCVDFFSEYGRSLTF